MALLPPSPSASSDLPFPRVLDHIAHHTHTHWSLSASTSEGQGEHARITLCFLEQRFSFCGNSKSKMSLINKQSCICPPFLLFTIGSGNIKEAALHIYSYIVRWRFQIGADIWEPISVLPPWQTLPLSPFLSFLTDPPSFLCPKLPCREDLPFWRAP